MTGLSSFADATDPTQTLSAVLPSVPEVTDWDNAELDDATLAYLAEDDGTSLAVPGDLRLEHYTEQVVAAVHGNPGVLDLDAATQAKIARIGRTFEALTDGLTGFRDDKTVTRRAAVLLLADGINGTPMRCPTCERIHLPLTGPVEWGIAGREDITCGPCVAAAPKHAKADPDPVKAKPRARPRPSRARKAAIPGGD